MAITLATAQRMIGTGLQKAEGMGVNISIAVTDSAGWLIAASRMDKAIPPSPEIAFGKAAASALFRRSGSDMGTRWPPGAPIPQVMMIRTGGRFVASQGGLPIQQGGEVVGGIGVSGATPQQDEEIAQAALETL